MKSALESEDFAAALEIAERVDDSSSQLLYLYETGLVLHYQGEMISSNEAFSRAEQLYEELYTKSISRGAASLVTSDNVIKYRGERYEIALTHYYQVLNYLELGDLQGAVVEARKINQLMRLFEDDGRPDAVDPFLEYLTALIYHAAGEYNDAEVSYRRAQEAYSSNGPGFGVTMPSQLPCDRAENLFRLGRSREANDIIAANECVAPNDDDGTIVLFLEGGFAPYRIEQNISMPIYKNELSGDVDDDYAWTVYNRYGQPLPRRVKVQYWLKVSIPELVIDPFPFPNGQVAARTDAVNYSARTWTVENIEVQAANAFEERRMQIIIKTILRGIAKYIAKQEAADEDEIAGWLVNLFNVVTETADTRGWTTLPQSIRMARMEVPAGTYDLDVMLVNEFGGGDVKFVIPGVTVRSGHATILNHRIF